MLYPQVLLGFAATVWAIDSYFHLGQDCDGPAIVCSGLTPNVCGTASASNTVGWREIPEDWVLEYFVYAGGGCAGTPDSTPYANTNFLCQRNRFSASLTGAKYVFFGRKRGEAGSDGPCESSVKPDTLRLEDGTTYDIVDLEENTLNEMVSDLFLY